MTENEYIIMPVGYANRGSTDMMSWVDFHFRYIDYLNIEDYFLLDTMQMLLLENSNYKKKGVVIQSATYQLVKNFVNDCGEEFIFESNKPKALKKFIDEEYHFTLCSRNVFDKKVEDHKKYNIIKEYHPKMAWIVYKIKSRNDFLYLTDKINEKLENLKEKTDRSIEIMENMQEMMNIENGIIECDAIKSDIIKSEEENNIENKIFENIVECIRRVKENDKLVVNKNMKLMEDLGFDSLEIFSLIVEIETIYETEFDDEYLEIDMLNNISKLEKIVAEMV